MKECTKQTLSCRFFSLYFGDAHKPRKSRRGEGGQNIRKKVFVTGYGEGTKNDQKVVYVT